MNDTSVLIGVAVVAVVIFVASQFADTPQEPQLLEGTTAFSSMQDVITAEDTYFSQQGKYLQVLAENKLPDYEGGANVDTKLGKVLPAGYQIHIYKSPTGDGYQVIYDDGITVDSRGFGPEAKERTYLITRNASSTP